jgi:mono/diheme cytochrome c family protein
MPKLARMGLGCFAAATLALCGLPAKSPQGPPVTPGGFEKRMLPFLQQHCFDCHGEQKQKGGLRLDELAHEFTEAASVATWLEVIEKLNTGEMPPESRAHRPTAEQSAEIVEWLAARIAEGDAARLAKRERVSFHRLTREEYANTVFDLLGVHFDVADVAGLIEDDSWRGFERIGSVLSLSASHLEKYLAAAEAILAEAYPVTAPKPSLVRYSAVDLAGGPETYGEQRYVALQESGRAEQIRLDLWPGQLVRAPLPAMRFEHSGQYRFRVQLSGVRSGDGRTGHLTIQAEAIDRLLFDQDVVAAEDEPIVFEFEAHLPAGEHEFALTNDVPGPSILPQLGRSGAAPFFSLAKGRIPWQIYLKDEDHVPVHPVLILDWLEWEGPLATGAVQAEQFMPKVAGETRARLGRFAQRAFRRPLHPGEIDPYVDLVEAERAGGADLRSAVSASMLAILCSQDFLYLVEGSSGSAISDLNQWELASRLSYFLWSTTPDDTLLELCGSGQLGEPEVLRAQVARLLADARSQRFVESFASQWLQLGRVGKFAPDVELYPEYDKHLERSMVRETTSFFGEVFEENLSLREFLASDWTMLNPRLARHYGIDGIVEDGFQRVALSPGDHRGGMLRHSSVLSLTSDGTRHRPVHRGVWLAESILGQVPPPPPANVEPIEPTPVTAEKATVRMQLEAHVSQPSCAACHRKIDPLGLAFDNYDAIGRWRTQERVPTGLGENPPVDASGVLPDGRRFSGATEFQQLLVDDIDRFHAAFVEKLATYALRRAMGVGDRVELERIAAESAASDYRLRSLIETLVLSDLFAGR